jgi:hypothetical protein
MDYTEVGQRLSSGLVQGFIVAFLSLIVFLPASYTMNRFIYRGTAMRIFMGVLAGMLGFGSFILLLCMRWGWGNDFKIRYFGLLPLITEAPAREVKPTYLESLFLFFYDTVTVPLTFYFRGEDDSKGYESTIKKLIQNFTGEERDTRPIGGGARLNIVHEPLFETGRELSKLSADSLRLWKQVAGSSYVGDTKKLSDLQTNISLHQEIGKILLN